MNETIASTTASRVGEVVEASTTEFATQCYELYEAPPLGSLVRCGEEPSVLGVVADIATRSMDPSRRPIARGRDETTEEGVYLNNPQLTRLLLTEFRSVTVGHGLDGTVRPYLPSQPPRIHAFVRPCADDEVQAFSGSLEFMPYLLSAPGVASDDLVAAFLRSASECHPDREVFLVDAGKQLAVVLGAEVQRLSGILKRLSP